MRYFIKLSYFGKAYHGWQIQPNAISVQEVLENRLSKVLDKAISVVGAGRTDAGVHARQLFAHFDVERELNTDDLVFRLNCMLPSDIAVQEMFRVAENAHARFDALSRSYEYHIIQNKDVFNFDQAYLLKNEVDLETMNASARKLLMHTNFKCFSRSRTDVKTYNCRIDRAEWVKMDEKIVFHITADRFLRNMVRAIVGTLLEVGLGRQSLEYVDKVIKSEDRGEAGASVPAHGLYLTRITYPEYIREL